MSWADPLELVGRAVRLRRFTQEDYPALFEAAQHDSLWQWTLVNRPMSLGAMTQYLDEALAKAEAGVNNPFCIEHLATQEIIGSTRYLEISEADRALEIGWTWIRPDYQRTAVNTECKFLLMRHAFEVFGAVRMQLKTDGRNHISQAAIERIGGTKEGVLRRNKLTESGVQRDTVYYSILANEWPAVKHRLIEKLGYEPD